MQDFFISLCLHMVLLTGANSDTYQVLTARALREKNSNRNVTVDGLKNFI